MRAGRPLVALTIVLSTLAIHSAHGAAGRTQGAFDVSSDGAATYTIPIWTPPGPRGMQPSLALTYSSLGGNGPMGVGWSLSGLSSIERCPRSYPVDDTTGPVTLTMADRYCLGTNRLRLVSGSYGAANSTYALEVDDFSVITASGSLQGAGPQSFTVTGKNGLTYEYGVTADARMAFATNGTVLRWFLNKVSDRDGNNYKIEYESNENVPLPKTISWAPSSHGSSSYRYSAVLAYADKTEQKDWISWYVAGNRAVSKKRLNSISINYQSTTSRKYVLGYTDSAHETLLSRLTSVKECANAAESDCLAPTTMTYQAGRGLSSTSANVTVNSGALLVGSADFNGDGMEDLIYTVGTPPQWYVVFGGNGGFGAPVPVTGMNGYFGVTVDFDNFLPGHRAAFIYNNAGTLYTYSANSAGTAFSSASTGLSFPTGKVPTGVMGRNGLAYLAWGGGEQSTLTNRIFFYSNTTQPGATQPSFVAGGAGNSVPVNVSPLGTPGQVSYNSLSLLSDRGLEHRDWEGDGYPDLYGVVSVNYGGSGQQFLVRFYQGGLNAAPDTEWSIYTGSYTQVMRFNDDDCSDNVYGGISGCSLPGSGGGGEIVSLPVSGGFWFDYDGDGRSDLGYNNSGTIGIYLSTGTGFVSTPKTTSIPYAADYRALDVDGDGLVDLARIDNGTLRIYTHTVTSGQQTLYLTQYPDLLASVSDGYGVTYTPKYVSTAHSHYSVGTQVSGLSDSRSRIVVAEASFPDGTSTSGSTPHTYTRTYDYVGAREDTVRGTFMGFQERDETDSRNNLVTKTYFEQIFPRTGWVRKQETWRQAGAIRVATQESSGNVLTLATTNFRQRYLPYVEMVTRKTYEPEGTERVLSSSVTTYAVPDSATGTVGSITTTLQNGDASDKWSSTTTIQYEPAIAGCLDLPHEIQTVLDRQSPDKAAITRKVSFTQDGSHCRPLTQTIAPDSSKYRVVTTFGYDEFGNVNSTAVDALEPIEGTPGTYQSMPQRTGSMNWGAAGIAPESITNALNQVSMLDYYPATGLLHTVTDPNGIASIFAYDGFGRAQKVTRPDQTSTVLGYSNCGSACLSNTQHVMTVTQTEKDANNVTLNQQYAYLDRFDRTLVTRVPLVGGKSQWNEVRYDEYGRVKQVGAPCSLPDPSPAASCVSDWTQVLDYDLLGRPHKVKRPNDPGTGSTISYDGLLTIVTDPFSRSSSTLMDITGNLRKSTDANGYYQVFEYDSANSLLLVTEKAQNDSRSETLFSATYDYGIDAFQTSSLDRALGARTRAYDGYGQLRSWVDGNGNTFTWRYDGLSRPVYRGEANGDHIDLVWGNDPYSWNIGQLASMSSTTNAEIYSETFGYDNHGRLSQRKITVPGTSPTSYFYNFSYDSATGALDTLTYPASTSGYRFSLKYLTTNGVLTSITDGSGNPLWTLRTAAGGVNAFGEITHDQLGASILRKRLYDATTGTLDQLTAGFAANEAQLQNASIGYDDVGNVTQRQNSLASLPVSGLTENFLYGEPNVDQLYRLTHVDRIDQNGTTRTLDIQYNEPGDVLSRTLATDDASLAVPVDLSVTWTHDNYPQTITAPYLSESVSFAYGPDRSRWRMVFQKGSALETTYYLGGLMEKVVSSTGTEYRHYIPGPEEMIGIYTRASSGSNVLRYLLNDYQGGIDGIVNADGSSPTYSSFAPFGQRRDASDWSGPASSTPDAITRLGYTFQTVLGQMGLNHMNGRVQDAITGTFLSPDPFVTEPGNTQNWNRYAYVYGNPMTYTDPSGFDTDDPYPPFNPCAITGCGPRHRPPPQLPPLPPSLPPTGPNKNVATQTAIRSVDKREAATFWHGFSQFLYPNLVAMRERGEEGTWGDATRGFLKAGWNTAASMARLTNPAYMALPPEYEFEISNRELAGAGTFEVAATLVTLLGGAEARIADRAQSLCFAPGTIVQTENGAKKIEDVRVGDQVWSMDERTGQMRLAEVVQTFVRSDQELVSVTIGNAENRETIRSTTEHPYWTTHGWVPAKELTTADQVQSKDGEWLPVAQVEDSGDRSDVYNFEVRDTHDYFVGEQGVLVHNACGLNSVAARGLDHVVLGKSIGLEARAASIGGRHLMGSADWQRAVMEAIANPGTKISVDVAGLEGAGSVSSRVLAAIQRGASGRGSPLDWELAQLRQSGRLSTVDFFEDANAIANPFR